MKEKVIYLQMNEFNSNQENQRNDILKNIQNSLNEHIKKVNNEISLIKKNEQLMSQK